MKPLSSRDQFWFNHVQSFLKSGLTQIEYCKRHGLNPKSFSVRKSLFSKTEQIDNKQSNLFIPINQSKTEFSIKLSSGIQLTFEQIPDPVWIGSVIQSLGGPYDRH